MAVNMFVDNIPNGSSLDIRRGTAIHLIKLIIGFAQIKDNEVVFDRLRIQQLAGAVGCAEEEAIQLCQRAYNGEKVEEIVDQLMEKVREEKEKMLSFIEAEKKKLWQQ
ncbi:MULTISPECIES: hypothetical protein [Carboxydocella]|uniref:Uncharacterized protein n=2 Tax=Carboxydocella TaxID=178898 RepID=A0A1T4Q7W4_9FIRM|nr:MULTISPECIES: hypothetical protein [Carboxydocella]AVX19328.1 hypothetical protein CFE_0118 [Carboxydocella thermautotrophica]AVX29742.1 hypothetical protein CTH_0122 [Carboxydocella thermautotrophica]SJZ99880.1 hypothetical protein SAMN02745885_01566 [Carboxydocella sporoproducens DSM 16521]GAW27448.1 hypothetical protein ULO1_00180 [Carboxydocella sp. ULO1]GAW30334.1 hypothetical protein JDF658_00990 [Carboxydocella sp. JDF658]